MLLATAAIAHAGQSPAVGLGGTSWQLVQVQYSDGQVMTPTDRSKYTVAFGKDGRASMRVDCNRGSGTWKSTQAGQLVFGPLAMTRAVCPPGSLYDRFVKDMGFVRSYVMKDGHLFLSLMADGGIYEFEPLTKPGASNRPLEATYWKAIELNAKPTPDQNANREAHLVFQAGGRFSGSDGCNRIMGTYEVKGDALTFGQLAGTQMACLDTVVIEQAFRTALKDTSRWKIVGDRLELLDKSGARVAVFQGRAPAEKSQ
jgi:heat shock protein HslJ